MAAAGVAMLLAMGVQAKESAFDTLVAAERGFAADAQARGVNAAFLAAAGEHGVVFRPAPLRVADVYANAPPAELGLQWGPAAAEIAPSGDLGYTFGPYISTTKDGAPRGAGHYFTVWERAGDSGAFHFRIDIGIAHALLPLATEVQRRGSSDDSAPRVGKAERNARMDALRELDSSVLPRLRRQPQADVYAGIGADDLVLLRDGYPPLTPPFDAALLAAADLGDAIHMTASERISADATLATTYAAPADGRGPSWVRVWRYEPGGWKLAVELLLAAPPLPSPDEG